MSSFHHAIHPPGSEQSIDFSTRVLRRRRRDGPVAQIRDGELQAAHLIVQTAESLAHRFVLRGIHDLDRATFVDEVGRLLTRYASGRAVQ